MPWAVYAPDGHWRAPIDQDLLQAAPALGELLAALPQLRLVICMGAKALTGFMRHITLTDTDPTRRSWGSRTLRSATPAPWPEP